MSSLTPYICVADTLEALRWYGVALGARIEGEPIVMDGGQVGHAEMSIGDATVYLSDEFESAGVAPPQQGSGASVTLHLDVPDCAVAVERMRAAGAVVDREPDPTPYGLLAVVRDPFGHRWMLNSPAAPQS